MYALKGLFAALWLGACSAPTDRDVLPAARPQALQPAPPLPSSLLKVSKTVNAPPSRDKHLGQVVEQMLTNFSQRQMPDFPSLFSEQVVLYNIGSSAVRELRGIEALANHFDLLSKTFSALDIYPIRILEAGNHVIFEYVSSISLRFKKQKERRVNSMAVQIFSFDDAGKIREIWSIQNEAQTLESFNMLSGIKSLSSLNPSLPTKVERVNADGNPRLAVAHKAFRDRISSPLHLEDLSHLVTLDFSGYTPFFHVNLTRDNLKQFAHQQALNYPSLQQRVLRDFFAGDYHAALVQYSGPYHGPLAQAEEPQIHVTFTSLEVIRVHEDGLIGHWSSYTNPMEIYKQLGLYPAELAQQNYDRIYERSVDAPPSDTTQVDADLARFLPNQRVGVDECDAFLAYIKHCVPHLNPKVREDYLLSIRAALSSWALLAKGDSQQREGLSQSCVDLNKRAKELFQGHCPQPAPSSD